MAKKQILTNSEIEQDVISALKHPPKASKASYKKLTILVVILFGLLAVIGGLAIRGFIYPVFFPCFLLALVVFWIGGEIFNHFRLKNRMKNVSITDYYITKEIVHSTFEEHYTAKIGGQWRQINNYVIRFQNGKSWSVSKEIYAWTESFRMQASEVYHTTHRGDIMIVVTNKDTGEIVIAYHTDIFEYML